MILWCWCDSTGPGPSIQSPRWLQTGKCSTRTQSPILPCYERIYIYISRYPRPASQQSQQCASKYSCCSSQAGHKGKEFLMQTCPFVSSPIKGFFLPQVSRGQENSKITGKTSARLQKLLDTLQKCRYLSLLFWHAPTGLQTGSRVVILYTLFSSLHFGQLAPAPAHLHSAVLEHASKSSS